MTEQRSEPRFSVFSLHVYGITLGFLSCVRALGSCGGIFSLPAALIPLAHMHSFLLQSQHPSIYFFIQVGSGQHCTRQKQQKEKVVAKSLRGTTVPTVFLKFRVTGSGQVIAPLHLQLPHPQNKITIFSSRSWDC